MVISFTKPKVTPLVSARSTQGQLKHRQITPEQALKQLVSASGEVSITLLDQDLTRQFDRILRDLATPIPVLPLLLWQNCYYLGSPIEVTPEQEQKLTHRLGAIVKIISIDAASYRSWFHQQNITRYFPPASQFGSLEKFALGHRDNRQSKDQ